MNAPTNIPTIPSVSLAIAEDDPIGFAQAIGGSFERYGFAIVSDHGIPAELIARAEALSKALFALPTATKLKYHVAGGGGARGYTPFGVETAKGATAHDLKEFWHVGRDLPPGHPYASVMAPNIWPDEIDMKPTFQELFSAF